MNSDSLMQLLQSGVRVTLGATASLVEVLQDPIRRDENLTRLRQEWSRLSEEWEVKGELTEQEARTFVNNLLNQRYSPSSTPPSTVTVETSAATSPGVETELQELTAQLAKIRAELETLRNTES